LSIVLFLAIITIESATTNNYFNYKDGNDNKKNIYRDKYDEERAKYKKKNNSSRYIV
jgi:1,4-dihydroxy-2-naphthoate octaprenyltransferase